MKHVWYNTRKISTGELYWQSGFPLSMKGFLHGESIRNDNGTLKGTIFSRCGKFVSCFIGIAEENPPKTENKEFTSESKDWKELVEQNQGEKLSILQSQLS